MAPCFGLQFNFNSCAWSINVVIIKLYNDTSNLYAYDIFTVINLNLTELFGALCQMCKMEVCVKAKQEEAKDRRSWHEVQNQTPECSVNKAIKSIKWLEKSSWYNWKTWLWCQIPEGSVKNAEVIWPETFTASDVKKPAASFSQCKNLTITAFNLVIDIWLKRETVQWGDMPLWKHTYFSATLSDD